MGKKKGKTKAKRKELPTGGEGGGGGYTTKFYTGMLCPEVQPLTLVYNTLTEKAPLSCTFS